MQKNKISTLFAYIEKCQGDRPWGHVLDAGTGVKSLSDEIEALRERALAMTVEKDGLRHGADYVIGAE